MSAPSVHRIADLLVLVLSHDTGLCNWVANGAIEREAAVYDRLLSRGCYRRLLVVTFDERDASEGIAAFRDALPEAEDENVALLCPAVGEDRSVFSAGVPDRVAAAIGEQETLVVKTDQMNEGGLAVAITEQLSRNGRTAALVARGGEHRSRKLTNDAGPDAPETIAAGFNEQRLCQRADIIVGTTTRMIEDLCWRHSVPESRARVVPNYVIRSGGSDACDPKPQEARDGRRILCVGPLARSRRTELVLEAMAHGPADESAQLEIIGEGPCAPGLRETIERLGINERVSIRPPVRHRELLRLMNESAIYVQASTFEGHPKTLLEAMHRGMAVVVTRSPGLSDTVQHGVFGLVTDPNAEAIGLAVAELIRDEDWRGMLASSASRHVAQTCGIDRVLGLEIEAHRNAITAVGQRTDSDRVPGVRWDDGMLRAHPQDAARRWTWSAWQFAAKLPADDRASFLREIDAAMETWRSSHSGTSTNSAA